MCGVRLPPQRDIHISAIASVTYMCVKGVGQSLLTGAVQSRCGSEGASSGGGSGSGRRKSTHLLSGLCGLCLRSTACRLWWL